MKPGAIIIFFLISSLPIDAQTLGGSSVFNFLRLSNTPQLTALGGENVSNQSDDIGMAFHNPSLLRETMHTQASFVFNSMYGGIKNYHLQAGYHSNRLKTNFAFGVMYHNYGQIDQTDASGNIMGEFKPRDYVVQLSMSRNYLARWVYGASLKYIGSRYGPYSSSGLAVDFGLSYRDTSRGLQASFVIKNGGMQLTTYTGAGREELPFDLQLGLSKRLKNAPLQFSLTMNRLHRFDLTYNDPAYNDENGVEQDSKSFSFDNIFRHIILATQVYITDKVEVSLGYNYLRRKELNMGSSGNGVNGFSAGVGVLFKKMQIRYGQAYYQSNRAYHQVGINIKLNEFSAFGKL
ncbi:MAG: type IX secretion system protein PorQ [Chitinophagaceae bacterium]|nr:MAG: type IX secretion system protein PorQ [Chitinophagaceae bacterium]